MEVSLLKRRISLHPLVSGTWGCNVLTRYSDLAAFTEELCNYSRGAAALRFLVVPFVPPGGAESPWEIGGQAPPSLKSRIQLESPSPRSPTKEPQAPAEAWVKATAALELRILLRECFVAASGTRDAGSQGRMAMKVLLREAAKLESTRHGYQRRQILRGDGSRLHLARVDQRIFEEVLRLMRVAQARHRNGNLIASQPLWLSGPSSFSDGSAVTYFPKL